MSSVSIRRHMGALALSGLLGASAFAGESCDPAPGQRLFESKCSVCHSIDQHKVGPRLGGVVGRKAGSADGFGYTPALEAAGFTWDAEHLDAFLNNPMATLPGTAMAFGGLHQVEARKAVICFLGRQRGG